jgi:hypothetical protein
MQGEIVKIGDAVKVVDEVGVLHNGICTANWGTPGEPSTCCNVLYLSADEKKSDVYGRQPERLSSCQHRDVGSAVGRYWFISGSVKPETISYYGEKIA